MNFRDLLSSGRVGLVGLLGAGGLFLFGCDDCGEEGAPGAQAPGNVADNAVVEGSDPLETVPSAPGVDGPVQPGRVTPVVAAQAVAEGPKWDREAAGYARYLPQDTAMYFEARQLDLLWELFPEEAAEKVTERLKIDELAGATGLEADEFEKMRKRVMEDISTVFPELLGDEVFVSVRGLDWWMQPYLHYTEVIYPKMIEKMVMAAADGDLLGMADDGQLDDFTNGLMDFMQEQLDAVGDQPVLAVQFGGKVTENREEVVAKIRAWLDLAAEQEMLKSHSFERNGVQWEGVQLDWSTIISGEVDEDEVEKIGKENWDRLLQMGKDSPLMIVCGEVGDYVVVSVGLGEQSAETVSEVGQSLVATEAFDFLREFEADSMLGISWMEGDLIASLQRVGSSAPAWDGVASGFAKSEGFGNGKLAAESVRKIARLSREKTAGKAHDLVSAVLLKDGIRLESRGGWQGSSIDLDGSLVIAAALDQWEDKPFFRAHWKQNADYKDKTRGQFEEAVKVLRLIGKEVSDNLGEIEEVPEDDEAVEEAEKKRRLAKLMEKDFLQAMENLWEGYRDHFAKALGEEVALVVDLKGEAPPVIGVEEDILKKGKIPRVAYVRPVKSREGLVQSWELWEDAGTRLLGLLSEAFDTPIPFPDTMSADSNDLRTHFFPMPFATDDFLPSLSVSDELFIVGSSKALASKIEKGLQAVPDGVAGRSGVLVEMEMQSFWDFCEGWVEIGLEKWSEGPGASAEDLKELDEPFDPNEAEPDLDAEVEDLLRELDELQGEEEELEVEEEEFVEEEGMKLNIFGDLPSFFDLEGLNDPADMARGFIDQARWFDGLSYHRWVKDGVPRSSAVVRWGDPSKAAE